MYEQYSHHGVEVFVRSDLKGKHREFCLCFSCDKFKPGTPDNCSIANDTFQNCVKHNLTTPVFECPKFVVGPDRSHSGQIYALEEVKGNESLRAELQGCKVMIHSLEHKAFWRAGSRGYTAYAWEAGVYSFEEAFQSTSNCGPEKMIIFVVC